MTRIAVAVAQRRLDLGLTQQTVADLAGVSRSSVQSLEYGTGAVKLASFVEIASILGLRIDLDTRADG